MTTTFCVSGGVLKLAGVGVSSTLNDPSTFVIDGVYGIDRWINEAESVICCAIRKNYVDSYATLNEDLKYILHQTAASMAALQAIAHDTGNYNSRMEAEDLINLLQANVQRNLSILRDKETQTFIGG